MYYIRSTLTNVLLTTCTYAQEYTQCHDELHEHSSMYTLDDFQQAVVQLEWVEII